MASFRLHPQAGISGISKHWDFLRTEFLLDKVGEGMIVLYEGCDSLVGEVGVLLLLFMLLLILVSASVLVVTPPPPTTTMGILRNPSFAESTLLGRLLVIEFFRDKDVDDFADDEDTFELFDDDFVSIEDDLPLLVLCCCCSMDDLELLALLTPFLVMEVVVAVPPLLIFVLIPLVDDEDDDEI